MSEEDEAERKIRRIVRQELDAFKGDLQNYTFKVETPQPKGEEIKIEETEECSACGTKARKQDRYCPDCGAEFED